MGAYAPAPVVTPELMDEIFNRIMKPTVDALAADGYPYVGILYGGLGSNDLGNPGWIITINPFTGAGVLVGPTGFPGVSGLTFCTFVINHSEMWGFDGEPVQSWIEKLSRGPHTNNESKKQ